MSDPVKQLLVDEMKQQEVENFKPKEINWLSGDFWKEDGWEKIVGKMKKFWKHKEEYIGEPPELYFLAHEEDKLRGKPQLIDDCKVKLPLVRLKVSRIEDKSYECGYKEVQSFHMIGEKIDGRKEGYIAATFGLNFYKYMVKTPDDEKVYLFSQKKLPSEMCTLTGMNVELDDFSEFSKTMKLPNITSFFFVKDAEPDVKLVDKEELIKLTKENKIDEVKWLTHLATHPLGTINSFPMETELLRSSFLLSGKRDGWPMHLVIMGPPGTRKSMGHLENIDYKFNQRPDIIGAGNSKLKGLVPSFKGTIVDVGYLLRRDRIAFVDELGKMIDKELQRHDVSGHNLLGDWNDILEHKDRINASGNTGELDLRANAKVLVATNPISNHLTIHTHPAVIDKTAMSRLVWWIQDKEEQDFVLSEKGIIRLNENTSPETLKTIDGQVRQDSCVENPPKTLRNIYNNMINMRIHILYESRGRISIDRDLFLTIFDSCYNFTSKIDEDKVQQISNKSVEKVKGTPMREIWEPRAPHHIFLIIDGLCKHRCLFRDYDSSFVATEEDYELAEIILERMFKGWNTDMGGSRE